jgi:hypothetical protein
LHSGVSTFASPTLRRQDVGAKSLLRLAGKAPMDRYPNGMDHLAVDV